MSQQDHQESPQKNNLLTFMIAGVVMIVIGIFTIHQPWIEPPLLKGLDLNFARVIINIGWFLVYIGVLREFFYKDLKEAMDYRTNNLERTFTEAENLKASMETMKKTYEERLQKTEADARVQIQSQIRESQDLQRKLASEGAERYDEIVAKGNADVEAERSRMYQDVQKKVIDLTLLATEKLLGENVDSTRNRKLVADYIETVGSAK